MVITNNNLCPHCGRPAIAGDGETRDHIFPDAYGGKGTVTACKDCNSGIGSRVEGKLLGPKSPFTLFLQGSGLPHNLLAATHPFGEFKVDLATGEHVARTSVEESEKEGVKTFKVFGSPDEVARIRAGLDKKYGDGLVVLDEKIGSPNDPAQWLNIDLSVNMDDLRRLVAKTALCALAYLQGDAFVQSAMATWLRAVLDAPREWPDAVKRPPQPDPDGADAAMKTFNTDEIFAMVQAAFAQFANEPIDLTGASAALLLIPDRSDTGGPRTLVIMSLMSWILPTGLVVPGIPDQMFAPIFIVQKQKEPIKIIDCAKGLPNGYEPPEESEPSTLDEP
jgi:hypothetical protein